MDKKITQSAETRRTLHTHTHTHTCSLLLSLLSIFAFISPSYSSGISSNANSASCDNSTLEKYTGSSNLTAGWTGNHIDLYWYADSEATTPMTVASESQDCTYGGSLTPPAASSMVNLKPGYTFRGWRVRQPVCQIPTSLVNSDISDGGHKNDSTGAMGVDSGSVNGYDLTEDNTWAAEWSGIGVVYGRAKCSALSGDNHEWEWGGDSSDWTATENEISSAGNGQYCWCRVTKWAPTNGNQCNITSDLWVFKGSYGEIALGAIDECAYYCAGDCTGMLWNGADSPTYRALLWLQ